jgi:hypothetical protein
MKKLLIIASLILLSIISCNKDKNEEYTIKGQFMNGTTMQPKYTNSEFIVVSKDRDDKTISEFGKFFTDDKGKFAFKYKWQKGASIALHHNNHFSKIRNIPINQNLDKSPWYFSDSGSVRISLKRGRFTNFNDTLFLLYDKNPDDGIEEIIIDSIINPQDGFYKQLRIAAKRLVFHYGINDELKYEKLNSRYNILQGKRFDFNSINGDPIIDECVIEF